MAKGSSRGGRGKGRATSKGKGKPNRRAHNPITEKTTTVRRRQTGK